MSTEQSEHGRLWRFIRDHVSGAQRQFLSRRYLDVRKIVVGLFNIPAVVYRISNWPTYYFAIFFAEQGQELVLHFRDGLKICFRAKTMDLSIVGEIFFEEFYKEGIATGIEPKMIIDLGGQIGCTSLWLWKQFPNATIHTIEPMSENVAMLQKNKELNQATSLHVHHMAVADHAGSLEIFRNINNTGGHSAFAEANGSTERPLAVPCDTFASFLEKNNITHCDLLKMDIEGTEYPVLYQLPPANLAAIDCLMMEYHFVPSDPRYHGNALKAFLEEHGFKVRFGTGARSLFAYR